ncbi:hypothetical protein DEU56DRAFT_501447 [Suillus clintonianus]|uniref:uncharacterized protein n=1 Tax=Suillus clintonianus TaxID=1904413 RepID=UPI001B86E285|nr:uncharacterized protein DEU56DRAFT_501447 [Suillus clintonianus]KAG2128970.1 hypothetical protein DEU56DRAFT_501447 [Suillus clintonianus]
MEYWTYTPMFWTIEDKTIVAAAFGFTDFEFDSWYGIYEFEAFTLKTVGTPFKGHSKAIDGLALSFDCALLASSSDDNTIKLWAFESRQLLASFHVQDPHYLIFSPNSHQLAYTAWYHTDIYVCNTPPEILQVASIQPAQQEPRTGAPIHTPLAHLPNSGAVRPDATDRILECQTRRNLSHTNCRHAEATL